MNIFLQIIFGFLLADFLTGVFHWIEDSYLHYCIDIPFIGEIAKDNELHHYFPRAMLSYSYWETIQVTLLITVVVLTILYPICKPFFMKNIYFISSFAFFSATSSVIHRFSHMRECESNKLIFFLQKIGILCSHKFHSLHHKNSHTKYCPIFEYNNYILDYTHFWRGLEYIVFVCSGIKPYRNDIDQYHVIYNHMHENSKLECPDIPTKEDVDRLKYILKTYKNCCNHF